jgi:hypothetical protein
MYEPPTESTWSRAPAQAAARLSAKRRALPDFVIVGGKRCGSTSLYEYIARHPGVKPSRVKKGTHYFDVNFGRGWSWYRSKYPVRPLGRQDWITGEASPYYMFHPLAPARIADRLPHARLIAVLREPVERAWSHYRYSVERGFEDLSFEEALDREPDRLAGEEDRIRHDPSYQSWSHRHHTYLARGLYADNLAALDALFPPDRILVLQSEALFREPQATLGRIFEFLGLPPARIDDLPVYKATRYAPLAPELRQRLDDYYAEPNDRLYARPGVDFHWSNGD